MSLRTQSRGCVLAVGVLASGVLAIESPAWSNVAFFSSTVYDDAVAYVPNASSDEDTGQMDYTLTLTNTMLADLQLSLDYAYTTEFYFFINGWLAHSPDVGNNAAFEIHCDTIAHNPIGGGLYVLNASHLVRTYIGANGVAGGNDYEVHIPITQEMLDNWLVDTEITIECDAEAEVTTADGGGKASVEVKNVRVYYN